MTFAPVGHSPIAGAHDGGTSAGIDTTGANLLVFVASTYAGLNPTPVLSDSFSNTWTLRKSQADGSGHVIAIYDVSSPTVGPAHTVSFTGGSIYSSGEFLAFSGAAGSPFDQASGATDGGSATVQPGSITPSAANCLLVVGLAQDGALGAAATIDSGFTAEDGQDGTASSVGVVGAYLVQSAALAVNPTFTAAAPATSLVAAMVSYLPAAQPDPDPPSFSGRFKSYQVAIGATSAASGVNITLGVRYIHLVSTVACCVAVAPAPIASQTTSLRLVANRPEYFRCSASGNESVAVIEVSGGSAGTLTVTEVSR